MTAGEVLRGVRARRGESTQDVGKRLSIGSWRWTAAELFDRIESGSIKIEPKNILPIARAYDPYQPGNVACGLAAELDPMPWYPVSEVPPPREKVQVWWDKESEPDIAYGNSLRTFDYWFPLGHGPGGELCEVMGWGQP